MGFSVRSESTDLQVERRLADSNRWNALPASNGVRNPLGLDCLKALRKAGRAAYDVAENGCWLWNGTLNSRGYPVRGTKDGRYLVHRRVMEETTGVEIPAGIQVHHVCETRRCVNPAHLRALDQVSHSREHLGGPSLRERTVAFVNERGVVTGADLDELAAQLDTTRGRVQTMLVRGVARGEIVRLERGVYGAGAFTASLTGAA